MTDWDFKEITLYINKLTAGIFTIKSGITTAKTWHVNVNYNIRWMNSIVLIVAVVNRNCSIGS